MKRSPLRRRFMQGAFVPKLLLFVLLSSTLNPGALTAAPVNPSVSSGSVTITQSGTTTSIVQSTDKAIINWQQFGINANELVQFLQPGISSVALNRVAGGDPSLILGALRANGQIFILNPNGIIFGAGSQVNVGGVLASTLSLSNNDFLNGYYHLTQTPGSPLSGIVNQGSIQANAVALAAPLVYNSGSILANQGQVALGAGSEAIVSFGVGQALINFPNPNPTAAPGTVVLPASAVDSILSNVVNNKEILPAGGVVQNGDGTVSFLGAEGLALNSGFISANGAANQSAGSISINSTQATALTGTSLIQANGQGANSNGGQIEILSQGNMGVDAGSQIQAKGGDSGNGGSVDVSFGGHGWIDGQVDTSAPLGTTGTFLIDPANVEIVNGNTCASDSDGGCSEPGEPPQTFVNVSTITGASANVTISTTSSITLDNFGGTTITVGGGHSLALLTDTGSMTFENTNDTITATGSITIRAGQTLGSGGQALLGKVTTTAGSLLLSADGNITYNTLTSSNGGVNLTSANGSVKGLSAASTANGSSVAVSAATGIGTSATPLKMNSSSATLTTKGSGASIFATNSGSSRTLTVSTNNGGVTITWGTHSLTFVSATGSLSASAVGTNLTFSNTGGNILVGNLTVGGSNTLSLSAGGAIAAGVLESLTAQSATLTAASIGTGSKALSMNAGTVSLTANAGDIFATDSAAASLTARANHGNITFTDTAGNLTVTTVSAGGTVGLSANAGAILGASGSNLVSGSSVSLTAGTGIGASGTSLNTHSATDNLTANNGSIFATDNIATTLTGSASNGNITFTDTTGNLTVTTVSASGAVGLAAGSGAILALNPSSLITASVLTLSAGGGIGTGGQSLLTHVGTLTGTSGGSIFLSNTGSLSLGVITANGSGSNITLATTGALSDAGSNLTADNITVSAGSTIGANAPITIHVRNGGLTVSAGGAANGISANFIGTIFPVGIKVSSAAGEVFFNGNCVFDCPATVSTVTFTPPPVTTQAAVSSPPPPSANPGTKPSTVNASILGALTAAPLPTGFRVTVSVTQLVAFLLQGAPLLTAAQFESGVANVSLTTAPAFQQEAVGRRNELAFAMDPEGFTFSPGGYALAGELALETKGGPLSPFLKHWATQAGITEKPVVQFKFEDLFTPFGELLPESGT